MADGRRPYVDLESWAERVQREIAAVIAAAGEPEAAQRAGGDKVSAKQLCRMVDEVMDTVERAGFEEACLQVEVRVINAERRQVSYRRWVPDSYEREVRALRSVSMREMASDEVDAMASRLRAATGRLEAYSENPATATAAALIGRPAGAGAIAFLATAVAHLAALFIAARRRKVQP